MMWFENRSGMYLKVHEHRKRKPRHLQAVRDRYQRTFTELGRNAPIVNPYWPFDNAAATSRQPLSRPEQDRTMSRHIADGCWENR
ncbi:Uncharacterised protein [Brucella intermedia]|nr:Uncharacterised protein [Brucella intermedia]